MKKIRVAYVDFWNEWPLEDFITPVLKRTYDVEITNSNPDIVFHSVFGNRVSEYHGVKRILYTGENKRPSQYDTDFSISYDPHTDTNYRLPLWQVYIMNDPRILDLLVNRVRHSSFERFCSFTVSNPSNFFRNGVYSKINSYKRVHSYGRYMTNDFTLRNMPADTYWRNQKEEFFTEHTHKYSICIENTRYPYYCTEKLMDAFIVGSMPLYWGDPYVGKDFNTESFIPADNNVLERIKMMESNDDEFDRVYAQPVFTDSQLVSLNENIHGFEGFLTNIIESI